MGRKKNLLGDHRYKSIDNTGLMVATFLTFDFYNTSPTQSYLVKWQSWGCLWLQVISFSSSHTHNLLFPVACRQQASAHAHETPACSNLPFLRNQFGAYLASPCGDVSQFLVKVHIYSYPCPYINIYPASYASLAKPWMMQNLVLEMVPGEQNFRRGSLNQSWVFWSWFWNSLI